MHTPSPFRLQFAETKSKPFHNIQSSRLLHSPVWDCKKLKIPVCLESTVIVLTCVKRVLWLECAICQPSRRADAQLSKGGPQLLDHPRVDFSLPLAALVFDCLQNPHGQRQIVRSTAGLQSGRQDFGLGHQIVAPQIGDASADVPAIDILLAEELLVPLVELFVGFSRFLAQQTGAGIFCGIYYRNGDGATQLPIDVPHKNKPLGLCLSDHPMTGALTQKRDPAAQLCDAHNALCAEHHAVQSVQRADPQAGVRNSQGNVQESGAEEAEPSADFPGKQLLLPAAKGQPLFPNLSIVLTVPSAGCRGPEGGNSQAKLPEKARASDGQGLYLEGNCCLLACRYCELELPKLELEEHENYCGSRTDKCLDCGELVMFKNKQAHWESNHARSRSRDEPSHHLSPSPVQCRGEIESGWTTVAWDDLDCSCIGNINELMNNSANVCLKSAALRALDHAGQLADALRPLPAVERASLQRQVGVRIELPLSLHVARRLPALVLAARRNAALHGGGGVERPVDSHAARLVAEAALHRHGALPLPPGHLQGLGDAARLLLTVRAVRVLLRVAVGQDLLDALGLGLDQEVLQAGRLLLLAAGLFRLLPLAVLPVVQLPQVPDALQHGFVRRRHKRREAVGAVLPDESVQEVAHFQPEVALAVFGHPREGPHDGVQRGLHHQGGQSAAVNLHEAQAGGDDLPCGTAGQGGDVVQDQPDVVLAQSAGEQDELLHLVVPHEGFAHRVDELEGDLPALFVDVLAAEDGLGHDASDQLAVLVQLGLRLDQVVEAAQSGALAGRGRCVQALAQQALHDPIGLLLLLVVLDGRQVLHALLVDDGDAVGALVGDQRLDQIQDGLLDEVVFWLVAGRVQSLQSVAEQLLIEFGPGDRQVELDGFQCGQSLALLIGADRFYCVDVE
ncbi:hypothetical protein D910_05240 [Dendroctonus ponderosae]|uniref:TRAFD1/XAF1 zinc finger domain-containing protein n=1 Tax=Dendroctonus ponderosae TaxID=77166 RepID=U4U491_DENPD|nr:hypothetical protein D910_05240 [Dendroctonus ponderosae]